MPPERVTVAPEFTDVGDTDDSDVGFDGVATFIELEAV